ncbi:response regulator [Aurantimonas sp. HBX-1]|uniref:response regulator n=1 Tax=Aurantimonas sp. HBX-1 TaxID=2906072 RepID=UPI001F3B95E5|nr:response regulator [Aurantimonas sp. HBX-1]UIJ73365.1 response regulator [Aurantimonas sp. HBX-1]
MVEDNLLVALDLIRGLQELKAELLGPVSRVQEALALISSTPPHAAVLDVNLLDGSVAPVADSLRRMGVPFVLLTGFDLPDEMKKNHPDVRAYSKPADPIQMGEKLAELLGR